MRKMCNGVFSSVLSDKSELRGGKVIIESESKQREFFGRCRDVPPLFLFRDGGADENRL